MTEHPMRTTWQAAARDAALEEAAKVADMYAVYLECNRGISPETQALIIRDVIRALKSKPVDQGETT